MDTLSLTIVAGSLLIIFATCAWVIKRHFVDRRWLGAGSRFIGRNVYTQWQNADEQERIEYVQYVKEDEREDTDSADPTRFEE